MNRLTDEELDTRIKALQAELDELLADKKERSFRRAEGGDWLKDKLNEAINRSGLNRPYEYQNGLRVCKVIKSLPESGRYLVALGEWKYDPRGFSVLIEFDDESRMEASVVAVTGYQAGIVIVR